jgi:hypothetical protein
MGVHRLEAYAGGKVDESAVDVASFASCMYARLSSANDAVVTNVMDQIARWVDFTTLAKGAPTYRLKGARTGGMLDGPRHLHQLLKGNPAHFESSEENFKLLLSLLTAGIAHTKGARVNFRNVLEKATREFTLFHSMNDPEHLGVASKLMQEHGDVLLGAKLVQELEGKNEIEQGEILARAAPHAQLFWHLCVLICRELFEGEHILSPRDAQILGLIDEVAGGGAVESRREHRVSREKAAAKKQN